MRSAILLLGLVLVPSVAAAQYPPPKNAQDRACRSYAANQVMSRPTPPGQTMETVGRRYWNDCMRRSTRSKSSKASRR